MNSVVELKVHWTVFDKNLLKFVENIELFSKKKVCSLYS